MSTPLATHDYVPGGLDAALEFLKRTRSELRTLRKVRIWKDKLQIIDVNKDFFEVRGLGYGDAAGGQARSAGELAALAGAGGAALNQAECGGA